MARTDPEPVEVVDLETAVAHDVHDAVGKGAHHAEEAVKPTYREAQVAGHKDLATDERLSGDKSEEILQLLVEQRVLTVAVMRMCMCPEQGRATERPQPGGGLEAQLRSAALHTIVRTNRVHCVD